MPKTLTPAMRTHLDADTTQLAAIWRITRKDGQKFCFTDHDRDIVFGGDTYRADAAADQGRGQVRWYLQPDTGAVLGLPGAGRCTARQAGCHRSGIAGSVVGGIADPFNDQIDAFRISHIQRSDGWIETTWNNMSAPPAPSRWQGPRRNKAASRRRWRAPVSPSA